MRLLVVLALLFPSASFAQTVRLTVGAVPTVSLAVPQTIAQPALSGAVLISPSLSSPLVSLTPSLSLSAPSLQAPSSVSSLTPPKPSMPPAVVAPALKPVLPSASKPDLAAESAKTASDARFDGSMAPAASTDDGVPALGSLGVSSTLLPAAVKPATPAAPTFADRVREGSRRKLNGVFIQQEQEGTFLARDPRDGSGDFFRWYRPVEMRPALVAQVEGAMGRVEKLVYKAKRAFGQDAWAAMGTWSRLRYLGELEAAVVSERGHDAAWNGKVSLILEKTASAPAYLTKNPHTEPPASEHRGTPGWQFLQPELVTDKDAGVTTVAEAIGRSRSIIEQTGHAGTQYHVFLKLAPKDLERQLPSLTDALQVFNDALFAEAAAESLLNAGHPSLMPWHAGRSARVRELVAAGSKTPVVSAADDADSEKHAFVGLRWWGMEDGKAVVSLELRGAGFPWKPRPQSAMGHGMETSAPKPERDSTKAEKWLTVLSLYAESVAAGRGPALGSAPTVLSAAKADAVFAAYARERGVADGSFTPYSAMAKRLSGRAEAPQGWLFPFAAEEASSPELRAFMDDALGVAVRMKASGDGADEQGRLMSYMVGEGLKTWARGFAKRRGALLERLVAEADPVPSALLAPVPAAATPETSTPVVRSLDDRLAELGPVKKPVQWVEHLKNSAWSALLTGAAVLMHAPYDRVAPLVLGAVMGAMMGFMGIFFYSVAQQGIAKPVAPPKVMSELQPKPETMEMIARIAKEAGLSAPERVRVLDMDEIQAFAGGIENSSGYELRWSRGAEAGNADSFEAIMRHELSHAKGKDNLWTVVAAFLAGLPSGIALTSLMDKPESFGWLAAAIAVAAVLLMPWTLRRHEYTADQFAASAPKGGAPLARYFIADSPDQARAESALSGVPFASVPEKSRKWVSLWDHMTHAFKSHPSHDRRIARLARLAK